MPKKFSQFAGPAAYRFVDPDTGFPFAGKSKQELADRIIAYREQNKLDALVHLDMAIDTYLCGLPENRHNCVETELHRTLFQYIQGGMVLFGWKFYGQKNMVSDEIANHRAAICVTCPQNGFPDRGPFLKWSDDLAEEATHGRKSSYHDKLGNCMCCSCCLRAKVFFGGKFNLTDKEKECMPDFCWQKLTDKKK